MVPTDHTGIVARETVSDKRSRLVRESEEGPPCQEVPSFRRLRRFAARCQCADQPQFVSARPAAEVVTVPLPHPPRPARWPAPQRCGARTRRTSPQAGPTPSRRGASTHRARPAMPQPCRGLRHRPGHRRSWWPPRPAFDTRPPARRGRTICGPSSSPFISSCLRTL